MWRRERDWGGWRLRGSGLAGRFLLSVLINFASFLFFMSFGKQDGGKGGDGAETEQVRSSSLCALT